MSGRTEAIKPTERLKGRANLRSYIGPSEAVGSLARRRTITKNTGTKKIASITPVNMPPTTPVPMSF